MSCFHGHYDLSHLNLSWTRLECSVFQGYALPPAVEVAEGSGAVQGSIREEILKKCMNLSTSKGRKK